MAGRHAAPESGSKKAVFIVITVIAALAVVGAAGFFVYTNFFADKNNKKDEQTTTVAVSTVPDTKATEENGQASSGLPDNPPTTEQPASEDDHQESTTLNINIPTEEGSTITHFNASFAPNGEVINLATGESATLRDVFGSIYPGGVITFNEDGSFTDTIGGTGIDSGEYLVENGVIKATYVYDRNMDITVTEWNDDNTPSEFYITYGSEGDGFRVYFSES